MNPAVLSFQKLKREEVKERGREGGKKGGKGGGRKRKRESVKSGRFIYCLRN